MSNLKSGREQTFAERYEENIEKTMVGKAKKIQFFGFLYGGSLGVIFMMYAGIFYFAAYLISSGILAASDYSDIFKVLFAILFAAMTAGQSGAMAPDFGAAKIAAYRVIKLLEREVRFQKNSRKHFKFPFLNLSYWLYCII